MSFTVACIARESPAVLERFITHYSTLGATEIIIAIDDAPDRRIEALAGACGETAVAIDFLDEDYWRAALGDENRMLDAKIHHCALRAKARCRTPWLFLTDADELLIARTPVSDALDNLPGDVDAVSMPTVEAVWGPGEDIEAPYGSTWFRRPIHNDRMWNLMAYPLYGGISRCMRRALVGHHNGKHFIRTAADFDRIGSHKSHRNGQSVTHALDTILPGAGIELAHFDAISLQRWREKFERRISGLTDAQMSDVRGSQVALLAAALRSPDPDAAARRLFRRLHQLNLLQATTLRGMRKAFQHSMFHRQSSRDDPSPVLAPQ